jgi:hypothetical protein
MHSYLNRSEHYFSDLEISDPGTVRVTNSYRHGEDEDESYIEES